MDLVMTVVVIGCAIVLFITEWVPVGQTAMLAAVALLLGGAVSAEEVFSGLANPATVTVGAMFVVSAAVLRTGAVNSAGQAIARAFKTSQFLGLAVVYLGAGLLSAFVNNTTVVAIMLPLMLACSRATGISPSHLLMPLSFAAMLGGTCTLIGTSTNLIVSSFAAEHGLAPIGMFELAPVGLIFFGSGVLYLLFAGRRILPARRAAESHDDSLATTIYLTDVQVTEASRSAGARLENAPLLHGLACEPLALWRDGKLMRGAPRPALKLAAHDVLRVRCAASDILQLFRRRALAIAGAGDSLDLSAADAVLVEAVVGPRSPLIERRIGEVRFGDRYDAAPLAVRLRGKIRKERLDATPLQAGDVLLLGVARDRLGELEERGDFVLISEVPVSRFRPRHLPLALAVLVAVVATAAFGWLSVAAAALTGAVLCLVTGCLRLDEAVDAVDWNIMMLLTGVIAIGHAMENSGAAAALAALFIDGLAGHSFSVTVGALYLGTALITSVLSNNATAALVTPLAIAIAARLAVDPRPLIMTVAFGASTAFLTPVGYQTNAMIYGAGRYRFTDFARLGAPLLAALTLLAAIAIPWVWPP